MVAKVFPVAKTGAERSAMLRQRRADTERAMQERLSTLQEELAQVQLQFQHLQDEVPGLQHEICDRNNEMEQTKAEIDDLRREMRELKKEGKKTLSAALDEAAGLRRTTQKLERDLQLKKEHIKQKQEEWHLI